MILVAHTFAGALARRHRQFYFKNVAQSAASLLRKRPPKGRQAIMKLKDTLLSVVIALILGWSGSTVMAEMVKIDSHLLTAMDSANEEDFIDVLLIVADGGRISMETARLARKRPELTGRYRAAYHQLQEKTAISQSDLINLLRDKTASGSVAEFKSYWIANVIYLRAPCFP
jgi:hypothetical protein